MTWLSRILRVLGIAIAIAAAIDPAMALMRVDRAVISLIDAGGGALTPAIARALAAEFDVHDGPIAGAAATLVVGDAFPETELVTSGALFAVTPARPATRVEIEDIKAPLVAPSGSKIPVVVSVRAVGMRGRSVTLDLFAGSLAADSVKRDISQDDERADVVLALPPAAAGLLSARVAVRDVQDGPVRHLVVDVRDERWRVLVADPRPSWASTFIRRALESDRRFDISSRVGTSKTVGAASGTAPSLTDTPALSSFDAIIVGAPDAMSAQEVRSLERYARERGGSVVLLLDQVDPGSFAPLLGGVTLGDIHGLERVKLSSAAGTLVATELAVPRGDGGSITSLARAAIGGKETPVIWQSPLGAGRVVVNGALDAWRYRTREGGGFARFWTDAVGAAAAASPAPLELTAETLRVAPGTTFEIRAIVRDVQLSDPSRPAPPAELEGPPTFWPEEERGVFHVTVRASDTPGNYQIKVQGSVVPGVRVQQTLNYVVAPAEHRPQPALLAAWTTSRGGTVLADDVPGVVSRVRTAVNARKERVETHPMRSPWWLPAFVILLGGEWWIRRRRGER